MTKQTDSLDQFEELHGTFLRDIVRPYDSRLRGNYFIHEQMLNMEGKGIEYDSGGIELAKKGLILVTSAASLYADEFAKLHKQVSEQYQKTLRDVNSSAHIRVSNQNTLFCDFERALENLNAQRQIMPRAYSYIDLYPAIATFKQISPESYRQGMGEMLIHQLRLVNMHGLSDYDPLQFSGLDKVLQMMPNPRFLGDKYSLVGIGLVKEVLSSKEGCRYIKEAREAIKRYELKDLAKIKPNVSRLLKTVEEMRKEELGHAKEKTRLTSLLESEEKQYISRRERILSTIGTKMHMYDYRE